MMSKFKQVKGAEFKLQWPPILNAVSESLVTEIQTQLTEDELVCVTEKINGSNLCLSDRGWVASRRQVICERIEEVKSSKFQGQSLAQLKDVHSKLKEASDEIRENFAIKNFELILFGEFVTNTPQDQFCYALREIKPGQLYSFGLALNFEENLSEDEIRLFQDKARRLFGDCLISSRFPAKFFILGFSAKLSLFLKERLFNIVPFVGNDSIRQVFTNKTLVEKLKNRELEGFVITGVSSGFITKWKATKDGSKTSHRAAISALKNLNQGNSEILEAVLSLESVCLSEKETDKSRKPGSRLFSSLLRSATSKYPNLHDTLSSLGADWNLGLPEVHRNYKATIVAEVQKDLIEQGFKVNSDCMKSIEGRVEAVIMNLVKSWISIKVKSDIQAQFETAWKLLRD